jgi:glycosyltransferase involved in cell wall biosynthesis
MNVAVIEPKWDGHHPTYFREFVLTLAELGCCVHAFCPKPDDEMLRKVREGAVAGRISLHQWAPPRLSVRPRRLNPRINWWLAFGWLKRQLRCIERRDRLKFNLLFFACLYDGDLRYFPQSLPWMWAGLYLHVRAFRKAGTTVPYSKLVPRPDKWFRRDNVAGIAVLDEQAVDFMHATTGCANVVAFPDFTDESAPVFNDVAADLKSFAAGRPIIGIAGHLQPTKGVCVLVKVAERMKSENVVFAFVGELLMGLFSPQEQQLLLQVLSYPNVFSHLEKLENEACFNGVVSQFDVFFAAYLDFPNSSNALAKAAFCRRPIIVSDGYLMAERVREYNLGEVVPEGDVASVIKAFERLLTKRDQPSSAKYAEYLALHSKSRLAPAFAQLLRTIPD